MVSSAHQLWVQQPKDMGIPGGLSGSLRAEDLREMGPILRMCWAQSSLCVEEEALRRKCHTHPPVFPLFIVPWYSGESHPNSELR